MLLFNGFLVLLLWCYNFRIYIVVILSAAICANLPPEKMLPFASYVVSKKQDGLILDCNAIDVSTYKKLLQKYTTLKKHTSIVSLYFSIINWIGNLEIIKVAFDANYRQLPNVEPLELELVFHTAPIHTWHPLLSIEC